MSSILPLRISPAKLARLDRVAAAAGRDRSGYLRRLIDDALENEGRYGRRHKFASADLLDKYANRQMQLADACLVCMSELTDSCLIWTPDQEDFRVYRRHGRQVVPCVFPGGA